MPKGWNKFAQQESVRKTWPIIIDFMHAILQLLIGDGIGCVVNLGAGFHTRSVSDSALSGLHIWEIDQRENIEAKQKQLRKLFDPSSSGLVTESGPVSSIVTATAASRHGACVDAGQTIAESTRLAAIPSSIPITDPFASKDEHASEGGGDDLLGLSAESDADAEFAEALADSVGDESEGSGDREHEAEGAKRLRVMVATWAVKVECRTDCSGRSIAGYRLRVVACNSHSQTQSGWTPLAEIYTNGNPQVSRSFSKLPHSRPL